MKTHDNIVSRTARAVELMTTMTTVSRRLHVTLLKNLTRYETTTNDNAFREIIILNSPSLTKYTQCAQRNVRHYVCTNGCGENRINKRLTVAVGAEWTTKFVVVTVPTAFFTRRSVCKKNKTNCQRRNSYNLWANGFSSIFVSFFALRRARLSINYATTIY